VDFDVVDHTNLQRQIIHGTSDVGRPKIQSAVDSIREINPYTQVDTYETMLTSDNALEIMGPYDVVVDGTDNFPTRYLVNDACVLLGKPNVYGSIFRFEGQASVFWAKEGPCYRCLYPEPPPPGMVPSCAEGGVLGILPGVIGVIQATETVKLIMGKGEPLIGRLLLYNALSMKFREMKLRRDPACPVCGENPTVTGLIDYEYFCGIGLGQDEPTLDPGNIVDPVALKKELDGDSNIFLLDVREPHEYDICRLPDSWLLPLGQLEKRINEVDREADIVVYCRSGVRSAQAVKFLVDAGYPRVRNLAGGTLAWSKQVDPSVPKY
jgi:adenylyltransferase/sulfurtransferase